MKSSDLFEKVGTGFRGTQSRSGYVTPSAFFVFALLLARFVSLLIALVVVLALLVGAADELHQSWFPGRIAGWDDWQADVVGTGLGFIRFKRKSSNGMLIKGET
jgi:VanZ family protein